MPRETSSGNLLDQAVGSLTDRGNEILQSPGLQEIGGIAISEATMRRTRPIEIANHRYYTNLPVTVDLFEESVSCRLLRVPLRPAALDSLPVGVFTVNGIVDENTKEPFQEVNDKVERVITVIDAPKGKAISLKSFDKNASWKVEPDSEELMSALGYIVTMKETLVAIPTPITVKKAARELGVDIRFFPEDTTINGEDYLKTFSDGKYPVALGGNYSYQHDIEDNHLTAMVLGGKPLKEALRLAASAALRTVDADIDTIASNLDVYTNTLRAVISPLLAWSGPMYGVERSRATLSL